MRFLIPLLILLPAASPAADILILSNGDKLQGTIKKLDKEVVTFSTDYSDEDFKIKWEKVVRIESDRNFLVEKYSGERISGSIQPAPAPLPDIAFIHPFERSLSSRIDWGFDVGYNMTKANSVRQLSAGTNLKYTGERDMFSFYSNLFFNRQAKASPTSRWELVPEYRRMVGTAWFANVAGHFYGSEEQRLSVRGTYGGGLGRYFFRSSDRYLALGGGFVYNRERYSDPAIPIWNSAESFGGAEYYTERFKFADLITRFSLFPSLTKQGRYRINYTLDLDFNLPGDWYIKSGYYNNFDSAPPAGLPRIDYGWRNSFGYKF